MSSSTQSVQQVSSIATQSEALPHVAEVGCANDTPACKSGTNKTSSTKKVTEKVLRRKGCVESNSEQFLIQWKGLPAKCNSWIYSIDLDQQAKDYIQNEGHKIRGKFTKVITPEFIHQDNSRMSAPTSKDSSNHIGNADNRKSPSYPNSKEKYPPLRPTQTYGATNGVMVTVTAENPYRAFTSTKQSGTETVSSFINDFVAKHSGLKPSEVPIRVHSVELGGTFSVDPNLRLNQIPPQPHFNPYRKHIIDLEIEL